MGYFDFHDLFAVVAELEIILSANGHPVKFGSGVAAVQKVYAEVAMAKAPELRSARQRIINENTCGGAAGASGSRTIAARRKVGMWLSPIPKNINPHLADCDALLVRSAVKVTKEVLAQRRSCV